MNAHILEILCYLILCCYQHSIIATSIAAVAAFAGFFRDFVHCVCMLASFGFCFGLRPSASNSVCWFLLLLATALCFCSSCLQLLPFPPPPPPPPLAFSFVLCATKDDYWKCFRTFAEFCDEYCYHNSQCLLSPFLPLPVFVWLLILS